MTSQQEFKAPFGYRAALVFSWLFFMILFSVILAIDVSDGNSQKYDLAKVVIGCLILLLPVGFLIWNHVSKTILIINGTLHYSSLFSKKQIPLNEIKGYKGIRHYIIIIPHKKEGYRKIRMTKSLPFNEWLSKNLTYLGLAYY